MIAINKAVEVNNMDSLMDYFEEEQERPCYNSFFDLNEPEILSKSEYEQMEFKKYGYAVINDNDPL